MFFKYLGFVFGIFTAYSLIKTQSAFSKKTGLLFTVFISKVSWLTLIITCYYGIKTFSLTSFGIGLIIPIIITEITFRFISNYIKIKIKDPKKMQKIKTVFEYLLILLIVKYVFF